MVYNYFSGLFSTSTSTQNSLTSLYNNLGDYSTIQSGSYKKLLSSYYKTTDDSSSDTSNKVSSLLQTTNKSTNNKDLTNLKSASDDLSKAGQKLLQKGSNTVFSEDNVDDMVSAVKTFATAYNKTITRAEDIADVNVTEKVDAMTSNTNAYAADLESIGITIGEDQKITVNEEKLKSADIASVKKILNSNNSFVGQTIQKATQIGSAIQNTINGIGLYNSSGSYAYLNTSSYEYYL